MLYWLLLLLQLFFAGFILYLLIAFVTGAPFVPSTMKTARAMVDFARIQAGSTIIDLGSGDGRLLLLAARQGAQAVGIEINPFLVLFTRILAFLSPYRGRVTVLWKNLWRADLRGADVVFVYLLPWRMEELAAKLIRELKPGSLVVTNSFIFPKWKILRKDIINHVYVYKI